jgi:hypothetical protein
MWNDPLGHGVEHWSTAILHLVPVLLMFGGLDGNQHPKK